MVSLLKKNKPVSFKFYKNGQHSRAKSLTNFCKLHPELGLNAKYHFAEVISGKRLHYKGWLLSSNKIKIDLNRIKKVEQTLIKQAIIS